MWTTGITSRRGAILRRSVSCRWLAVPVGLAWGGYLCWRSVRLAQQRLERQGPEIFARARAPVS